MPTKQIRKDTKRPYNVASVETEYHVLFLSINPDSFLGLLHVAGTEYFIGTTTPDGHRARVPTFQSSSGSKSGCLGANDGHCTCDCFLTDTLCLWPMANKNNCHYSSARPFTYCCLSSSAILLLLQGFRTPLIKHSHDQHPYRVAHRGHCHELSQRYLGLFALACRCADHLTGSDSLH